MTATPARTVHSGALAFGIGTSEVQHVLATQALPLRPFAPGSAPAAGRATSLTPFVTWGPTPDRGRVWTPTCPLRRVSTTRRSGRRSSRPSPTWTCVREPPLRDVAVDTVFLGSCTNGRIEDQRAAAAVLRGHRVRDGVRMLVVPGSMQVKQRAEAEGTGSDLRRGGRAVARHRLLDVSRYEPGPVGGHGGPRNPQRPFGSGDLRWTASAPIRDGRRRFGAATSIPTRSSRRHLKRVTRTGFEDKLSPRGGPTSPASSSIDRSTPMPRSWWPARTSGPARRGSTWSGRCRTTASE